MNEAPDSMRSLSSVRPPEADLTLQVVSADERRELFEKIVESCEPLPSRLERVHRHPLRHAAARAASVAVVVLIASLAGVTMWPSSHGPTSGPGTGLEPESVDMVSVSYVAARTSDAIASTAGQQLNVTVAVTGTDGSQLALLDVSQSPAGDTTKIDELDAGGALVRSTLLSFSDGTSSQRVVDYVSRTWSESSEQLPVDDTPSDERGVVFLAGGMDISAVGVGWVGSPEAMRAILDNGRMTVVADDDETIHLRGDLSGLGAAGVVASKLSDLTPGAQVDLWFDAASYLPSLIRVEANDGSVSEANVRWMGGGELTLAVPEGFEFR